MYCFNLDVIMAVAMCINTLLLLEINQYRTGLKFVSFIVKHNCTKQEKIEVKTV